MAVIICYICTLLLAFAFPALATVDDPVVDFCDDGWVNANGFCYLVKSDIKATHRGALKDCRANDASLLTIETQDELDFITGELADTKSTGWWTSLYKSRGAWMWTGDWPADTDILQWSQEPNNALGNENCAAISEQMTYSDEACSQKYGYLCEVSQIGCPMGFLIGPDKCLFISDTFNKSQLMTKDQAAAKCASLGTNVRLANLESIDNVEYLKPLLPKNAQTPLPWWVDVKKTNEQWAWADGSPASLTWAKEPDNMNAGERCATLVKGKFADKACNILANYVCKKTDGSVPTNPYEGHYGCGNWPRAGKKCYFFQMWGDTADSAQAKCRSVGADLLRIDSLDEKYWLDIMATNYRTPFWTQLKKSNAGAWQYSNGNQPSADVLVWNQEPNDYMGVEDCVGITVKQTWNDNRCGQSGGYICETQSENGNCPPGWVVNNNNGRCYYFGPPAYNASSTLFWSAARQQCQQLAEPAIGTLLAIDDTNELDFVNSQLSGRTALGLFHWTGLNDLQGEGILTYVDNPTNQADITILPWDQSPSCQTCSSACAVINSGGYFEDFDCSVKYPFVCEKGYSGNMSPMLHPSLVTMAGLLVLMFIVRLKLM